MGLGKDEDTLVANGRAQMLAVEERLEALVAARKE
jgi:hypothetical protein